MKRKLKDLRSKNLYDMSDGALFLHKEDNRLDASAVELIDSILEQRGIDPARGFQSIGPEYFDFAPVRRRIPGDKQVRFKKMNYALVKYGLFPVIPLSGMASVAPDLFLPILFFATLAWLAGVMVLPWLGLREKPVIGVCLRPFDDKKMSVPLKRFLRSQVGFRAHLYTLSDREFKNNTIMKIGAFLSPFVGIVSVFIGASLAVGAIFMAILAPWIRQSPRVLKLKDPAAFIFLDRELERSRLRSGQSVMCGGTPFNIKCRNDGWQPCVQFLAHKSDFIIVDLTHVGPSVGWELDHLREQLLFDKCIFVSRDGEKGVHEAAAQMGVKSAEIFPYDERGEFVADHEAASRFWRAIAQAVS